MPSTQIERRRAGVATNRGQKCAAQADEQALAGQHPALRSA